MSKSNLLITSSLMDVVQRHPQHALIPFQRQRLYASLSALPNKHGQSTCGWLAVITASHVLPFWQSAMPDDSAPAHFLEVAQAFLRGRIEIKTAKREYIQAEQRFGIEESAEWKDSVPIAALRASQAAICALKECLQSRLDFLELDIAEDETDADIDPWSHDTAQWAEEAVAGGVWEPASDAQLRLQFWRWWLTTAIPQALDAS